MNALSQTLRDIARDHADPVSVVAAFERAARRIETPCGDGVMVWRIWGEGEPLLLLHGGSGSWKHWIRNVPALTAQRQVIAPDLPGYGDSADPPGPVGFASIAHATLDGLTHVLPADARFDVGGFSFGSLIAQYIAQAIPARVRSMMHLHGVLYGNIQMSPQNILKRWRGVADPQERRAIMRHNLLALMMHRPDAVDELALHVYADDLEKARLRVHEFIASHDGALIGRLAAPLITITGEHDPTSHPSLLEQLQALAAARPDAQSHVIPAVGHWVNYEAAGEVDTLLLDWLKKRDK